MKYLTNPDLAEAERNATPPATKDRLRRALRGCTPLNGYSFKKILFIKD
jgi:hypothetical protein